MTLAPIPPDECPDCQAPLTDIGFEQPALFRHAGYGADVRTVVRACRCGWRLVAERSETRPERRPA